MKNKKGITLVALIITVIILLILATVSINLIINSGIITKSKTAVDKYSEEDIKTQIKLANDEYTMAKFDETDKTIVDFLQESLGKVYDNVIVSPKSETEIYPVSVKVKNVEYDILSDGTIENHIDFTTLESLYGKVVNGYTGYEATDVTEWKLLYVDEENRDFFIISSNTIEPPQPTANGIPLYSKTGNNYSGTNSILKSEYGKNYNKLWLDKCLEENKKDSAKAVAYLCDLENWNQYVTGKAKYSAGAPTLEIIVASFYNKQVSDFICGQEIKSGVTINASQQGYPTVINSGLTNGGFYNTGIRYWLASPSWDNQFHLRIVRESGCISGSLGSDGFYRYTDLGLRPVVCLPASAIQINGTGDNITLEYK